MRARAVDSVASQQRDDSTQDHGLSNAHLHCRNPNVTNDQDDDRNERQESLDNVRLEVVVRFLNLSNSRLVTLVVAQNDSNSHDTEDHECTAGQGPRTVESDEVHDFHAGHVSNESVVRRTRREVRTDRTTHHSSSGSSRLNTSAEHHRDQRGTDSSGTASSRRDSDVDPGDAPRWY